MAVTINSAELVKPESWKQVDEKTADIDYTASVTIQEESNSSSTSYYYTVTEITAYEWKFSDGGSSSSLSGTHTWTGLTPGENNIDALSGTTFTVRYTITTYSGYYDWWWIDEEAGTWDGGWYDNPPVVTEGEETTSVDPVDVYTHPGKFTNYDGAASNVTIKYVLTASNVAAWDEHCGKYLSWGEQADLYGTINSGVSSDDVITAEWYNKSLDDAKASDMPRVTKDVTVIYAFYIKNLAEAISRKKYLG